MHRRTIPLCKEKYPNRKSAVTRARELGLATGERLLRMFETRRYWVAHVVKPQKPGEGYR